MWPMYANTKKLSDRNPLAVHWAPTIFTDTTLYYAALFAFSKFRELLLGHCPDKSEQLQYLKLAFSNLRLKLSGNVRESIDPLILTALSLVPSETLQPNESMVVTAAWIPPWHTLYARTTNLNPHVWAAFELVKLKGGIEKIEMFGLPNLIA